MKAYLDANGTLKIGAETPLESFALKQWFKNFKSNPNEVDERFAFLEVYTPTFEDEELSHG